MQKVRKEQGVGASCIRNLIRWKDRNRRWSMIQRFDKCSDFFRKRQKNKKGPAQCKAFILNFILFLGDAVL